MAKIVNSLMASSSRSDSVFFLSYDEGGGPYEHVPPVAGTPMSTPMLRWDRFRISHYRGKCR